MLRSLSFVAALSLVALIGCSSEEEGKSGPFAPPANGVPMGEKAACELLQTADLDRREELGCGPSTVPSCPGYLRKNREPCLQYDQGTVQGCAAYISGLGTCEAVAGWKCVVQEITGSAGLGCPAPVDAGPDAPIDGPADAPADTGSDAALDAGPDADAAADGPSEAGTD
jgi:hypothetical protein